jgi:hypothetical protein
MGRLVFETWHIYVLDFLRCLQEENNIVRALEGIFRNSRFKGNLEKPGIFMISYII